MGQKVNPVTFRLGITVEHGSVWYADKRKYAKILHADIQARNFILKALRKADVSTVSISRPARNALITVKAARPAVIIGKKGEEVEKLKLEVSKMMGVPVHINIQEIKKPDIDPILVSKSIAQQLERRVTFRRAMKKAISSALRQGAKGIKISVSGRLGGAEIARTEKMREGCVPLHTLKADVDYGFSEAKTTAGIIGVKVWIHKAEIAKKRQNQINDVK